MAVAGRHGSLAVLLNVPGGQGTHATAPPSAKVSVTQFGGHGLQHVGDPPLASLVPSLAASNHVVGAHGVSWTASAHVYDVGSNKSAAHVRTQTKRPHTVGGPSKTNGLRAMLFRRRGGKADFSYPYPFAPPVFFDRGSMAAASSPSGALRKPRSKRVISRVTMYTLSLLG